MIHSSSRIVLLFLLFSCRKKQETFTLVKAPITASVYASGTVKVSGQYDVYPATTGIIRAILVKAGDTVRKGDPLMILAHEAASLNAANALLSADYNSIRAGSARLQQARLSVQTALLKKNNDDSLLRRQRALWQQGIGSRNELDQRELTALSSAKAYDNTLLQYQELSREMHFSEIQAARNASVSASIANDYIIRSDRNGRVYNILKDTGEMATIQSPVATIGDAGNFELELQVDEYDISEIQKGQKVLVSFDTYRNKVFEAYITIIEPIMTDRSRSFKVTAKMAGVPPALYPNMTAEANILVASHPSALVIPRDWLINDSFVLLRNGDKRPVVTGLKDYRMVEIRDGLHAGDKIIKPEL